MPQVPVQTVATGLTTTLNFLEVLGVRSKIKVLVCASLARLSRPFRLRSAARAHLIRSIRPPQDMSFVTSPCAMRLAECGKIEHVDAYGACDAPEFHCLSLFSGKLSCHREATAHPRLTLSAARACFASPLRRRRLGPLCGGRRHGSDGQVGHRSHRDEQGAGATAFKGGLSRCASAPTARVATTPRHRLSALQGGACALQRVISFS